MPDIQRVHDDIFLNLQKWRSGARHSNSPNPFFYLRSVRDERFRKGFWFPGNDEYLCVSFWAGGDSHNKTPNIYFEVNKKKGCSISIVSKDSTTKYEYFSALVTELNKTDSRKYVQRRKAWTKWFSDDYQDYLKYLWEYIDLDKEVIDSYILSHDEPEYEEFTQKFGFIDPNDFDKMYSKVLKERDELKSQELAKRNELLNRPQLPFSVSRIGIENYQGIKSCIVSDLPIDVNWMFITGENGYGKTSLLQSIALGLNNNPDLQKYDNGCVIEMNVVHRRETDYITRRLNEVSQGTDLNYADFILGYGPSRLNVQAETSENIETKSKNSVLGLFENTTLLKNINYELFTSNITDFSLFTTLSEVIKEVTKDRIISITVDVVGRQVLFTEKLSNGDILEAIQIKSLAAGFRNIINLVFDIFMRLRDVHNSNNPKDFYGIVLIDEIENHLHPILQKELIENLSKVFPNIYFIVTTHSPIPLLGAPKNSIILTVKRDLLNGVVIERLDDKVDFPNLLPNSILTSPVFGFHDIIPKSHDPSDNMRVEATFSEILENNQRKEKINEFLNEDLKNEMLKLMKR